MPIKVSRCLRFLFTFEDEPRYEVSRKVRKTETKWRGTYAFTSNHTTNNSKWKRFISRTAPPTQQLNCTCYLPPGRSVLNGPTHGFLMLGTGASNTQLQRCVRCLIKSCHKIAPKLQKLTRQQETLAIVHSSPGLFYILERAINHERGIFVQMERNSGT